MIDSNNYLQEPEFENYKKLCMDDDFIKLRIEIAKLEAFDHELSEWLKKKLWKRGYSLREIQSALDYGRI